MMTTIARKTRSLPRKSTVRPLSETLLDVLPAQGDWTEEDYLWLSGRTHHLLEYTNGFIEVLPMPTDFHQKISKYLFFALAACMQRIGGDVMYAPLRIRLPSGRFREPDLLLFLVSVDATFSV